LKKVADGVVLHGSVGRAKRAGYGRFAIRPTLGGAPTLPKIEGDSATLYFETDALLPADGLALSPEDFIVAELTAFGTRNIKIQDGDMRTRRLDGWLTRWGLPRPSFVTIAAGSTITIVGNGLGPALASIAVEGIGGRRGEGFGRVRVNDPLVTTDLGTIRKVKKAERTGEATRARADLAAPTGAARSFLKRIEQRAVAGAIRLAAEVAASDGAKRQAALGWRGETPSMSQLGALRTVMNGLRNEGDRQRTITFLKNLQGSDREQRWGGAVANSKLIHQFEDEEAIWRTIEVDDETLLGTAALSTPADLRLADRDLALASFVAAATRAHKRDMEKG
jgi:CRISPR-associated protein Csx10